MSFDPITGIWAANKAAEIAGASGGGSGGSTGAGIEIDLMSFGIDLAAIAGNGGSGTVENTGAFWDAIGYALQTKTPIILKADGTPYGMLTAVITNCQFSVSDGVPQDIAAIWLNSTYDMNTASISMLYILLARGTGESTQVHVVTPNSAPT